MVVHFEGRGPFRDQVPGFCHGVDRDSQRKKPKCTLLPVGSVKEHGSPTSPTYSGIWIETIIGS
jgi:hypothetical protein